MACPKVDYKSRAEAKGAAAMWQYFNHCYSKRMNVYYCKPCGSWHITSGPLSPTGRGSELKIRTSEGSTPSEDTK